LWIHYYAEGSSTPVTADPIVLLGHKAGSLFIGNVTGISDPFKGGAVLESDVPVIATAVNIAQTGPDTNYARPLYTAFDPSLASADFFVPTVLYQKFGFTTSTIGIQNVGDVAVNATLSVYAAGSATAAFQQTYAIQPQSSKIVTAADMAAALGVGFTGSAVISAPGGAVVASAQETADAGRAAKAFEGLPSNAGATTIYMASMMCQAFGTGQQTSFYAVQNVGGSQASVEIDFYNTAGALVYTATGLSIPAGNKISANPCQYVAQDGDLQGVVGSAVIRSTNGVPLIAMGKVSGASLTETAFVGQSAGGLKVAAPYIRWKTDPALGERSYVAIMNVGAAAATNVIVRYYNASGAVAATHDLTPGTDTIGQFIKANTNWQTASGANTDFGVNPFGGAIEVESDQPVIVIVRVQKSVGADVLAEDYNGMMVP
ncbi:MAG TPA: hypothetical protein VLC52_12995, partial [Anaerolineae bacterium]|nr:hypothetical protein [Anaerolineae bacterium]